MPEPTDGATPEERADHLGLIRHYLMEAASRGEYWSDEKDENRVEAADLVVSFDSLVIEATKKVAAAARQAREDEREACAKVADGWYDEAVCDDLSGGYTAQHTAEAIRARKDS